MKYKYTKIASRSVTLVSGKTLYLAKDIEVDLTEDNIKERIVKQLIGRKALVKSGTVKPVPKEKTNKSSKKSKDEEE